MMQNIISAHLSARSLSQGNSDRLIVKTGNIGM